MTEQAIMENLHQQIENLWYLYLRDYNTTLSYVDPRGFLWDSMEITRAVLMGLCVDEYEG